MNTSASRSGARTIVDSHAHVVSEYYGDEREDVIARAFQEGVVQMVNPGVVLTNLPELFEIAERHANIFLGVGLHPHDARHWDEKSEAVVKKAAEHEKVVGIGECGLDFFYNNSDHESQVRAFRAQLRLSRELDKPVIVHCRDAWQEAISIIKEESGGKIRGVFHCFTGDETMLPAIKELDFYVSFSGIVTFPNAKKLQAAAPGVPENRLLVETDCPFLAPQKVRGKRNEPAYVWHVAEKLAELRGTTVDSIAETTARNARDLFRLPAPVVGDET